MPPSFGFAWKVFILLSPAVFVYVVEPSLDFMGLKTWSNAHLEARRDVISSSKDKELAAVRAVVAFLGYGTSSPNNMNDLDIARCVFKHFDANNSNTLEPSEVSGIMADLGLTASEGDNVIAFFKSIDMDGSGSIDFNEFYEQIWKRPARNKTPSNKRLIRLTKELQAKIVFDAMDADDSGFLEVTEIESVLMSWGLSRAESHSLVIARDTSGDGKIDLQEFIDNFREVYEFGIDFLLSGYPERK